MKHEFEQEYKQIGLKVAYYRKLQGYTQEELEKAAHNYELTESDSTVLCIDYAMNGIGSNSCGPVVLDAYRFSEALFRFQFEMVPFVKE